MWSFEALTRGMEAVHAASLSLQNHMMARGFMFDASIDSGCFVDVFSWMKPLRLNDFLLFGAAKLQIWTNHLSLVFSSARISELGHKFRLSWIRLKFRTEDFVVENWQVWGPEFRDKSIHEMAAKAATGEVHQPLAKSPCLWPHFYGENLSLFRLSVPLVFLSTFPFPFFFLSSFFFPLLFPSFSFPFSSHPFSIFIFRSLSPSCSFPFFFPFPFLFIFSSLPSIFSFFSSSFPPPLMGGWGVWRDGGQRHYKCQTESFSWDYRLSPFTAKGPWKRLFWHVFRKSHHCGQLG